MAKKMKRSATEDESSSNSASSGDEIFREEAARQRRRSRARKNAKKKEGKDEIKNLLAEVKEVCKQSKQVTEIIKEEMYKQFEKIREEICQQSKQASESKEEICKQLENVKQDINKEMHKHLTEILTNLSKQYGPHTSSSGDDSYAPRSQSNQVPPPRYRLEFKSGVTDGRIEKGQLIDISVALVDGSNGQTVENGPLASATVELVVVNAEFNQHNNQYNWSREDFESNIKKPSEKNPATGDVDQSVKSIVSNGQFNLVHGARRHSGSKIFSNSSNKKVRLGLMVVSQTEERVLEALSDPFYVRGHDRPARQSNSRHNRSNTQKQALDCNNGYQEQTSPMPNLQNPSCPNPTQAGGITRPTLDNSYQVQNGQMPNLQNSLLTNSTQTREIRFNTPTGLQLPFLGDTTMPPSGLNINDEQQLPFMGNTPMLSAEPSTINQEPRASMQYHNFPHLLNMAQATNNQIDELSSSTLVGHLRNPNYMGNSHIPVDEVGMQFMMNQRILPVQLLWDRSNVEPAKRRWNLFDKLNTSLQKNFGSLSSLGTIQKSVLDTRQRSGAVLIEPLELDDSDEERPLRSRRQSKYQLRFVNKVCEAYYTRDQIKADDGNLLVVALFDENNTKITSGPLSSASVEVVALHGDFNVNAQDYWTPEEFSRSVVCPAPGEKASSVLGGDRTLVLAGGEACIGDAFFRKTSFCARTAKFKMGVRLLASTQEETIQEGISEPFRVIDRLVEELSRIDDAINHKAPPPGFRFRPTHKELVEYLCHGYDDANKTFPVPIIAEVDDIYKFDPWDLPSKAAFGDDEWYFFSQPEPATSGTLEMYRAAGSGYWNWKDTDHKETAIPLSGEDDKMVGFKKTLVFYTGDVPRGNETNWIMDEYRLSTSSSRVNERVLCKIYKKPRLVSTTLPLGAIQHAEASNTLRANGTTTRRLIIRYAPSQPTAASRAYRISAEELPLPPGFRFFPTDEELIWCYLGSKVANERMASAIIGEVDLYKHEPWDLPDLYKHEPWELPSTPIINKSEWYFFSRRDRKNPRRATPSGYWKATGKDRTITALSGVANSDHGKIITLGYKKKLVFYTGRAPRGERTNWLMHEYRLHDDDNPLSDKESAASSTSSTSSGEWLLYKIFKKTDETDQLTTPFLDEPPAFMHRAQQEQQQVPSDTRPPAVSARTPRVVPQQDEQPNLCPWQVRLA